MGGAINHIMKFSSSVGSFCTRAASRANVLGRAAVRKLGIAVPAALGLAAVLTVSLTLRHRARVHGVCVAETVAPAGAPTAPAQPPPGLSRQRKGFKDAIATLKSAADQDHHLAAYYPRVVKRTGGQPADVETSTSVQASPRQAAKSAVAGRVAAPDSGSALEGAGVSVPAPAHDPDATRGT